jgi:hypothetical protein
LAGSIDFEKLLWVPKPIVVVPAMPSWVHVDAELTRISVSYIDATSFGDMWETRIPGLRRKEVQLNGVWQSESFEYDRLRRG